MCIVFLALSTTPKQDGYKVIIAANRDEFFNRPAKEADFWEEAPDIISGIDLFPGREGGTWIGMSKSGKIGVLTNYRQSRLFVKPDKKGRGELVTRFLTSGDSPRTYIEEVKQSCEDYNGFNLLVGKVSADNSLEFSYYCNQEHKPLEDLNSTGIHCLSNRYLDYGWRKVVMGKEKFGEIIETKCPLNEKIPLLFELLQDKTRYPDDKLFSGHQDVGIPSFFLEGLSAISVLIPGNPTYGTRTNTIIIVDDENNVTFVERTMEEPIDVDNIKWKTNKYDFKISS